MSHGPVLSAVVPMQHVKSADDFDAMHPALAMMRNAPGRNRYAYAIAFANA